MENKKGSLVNVGLGMTLGAHITPISRNFIEKADVVFVAASNNLVEEWVKTMNKDVRSLQPYYNEGTSRMVTYKKWVDLMIEEVRSGKAVCGAFYGHPGVFAWSPHESIRQAKEEGYVAHMEPGISAEDCLYADLNINPGSYGCLNYTANQVLFHNKTIDTSAYVILWQVSITGDRTMTKFNTELEGKKLLLDKLLETYPENHKIILYECAVLPTNKPRIEKINLYELLEVEIKMQTTIVISPL